jgi:Sap, sulfolipid-1-addressing protein
VFDVLEIVLLAAGSALWPLLLIVVVLALNTDRPVRILGWFYLGGMLTTISVSSALVFRFQGSTFLSGSPSSADAWLDLVIGALCLLAALVLHLGTSGRGPKPFHKRPPSNKQSRSTDLVEKLVEKGAVLSFVAGIVATILPGPLAIIGMKNIAELDYSNSATFAMIVLFYVIMFALVEIPLVGFVVAPVWTKKAATDFNNWLARNLRSLAIWALTIVGAVELVRGIFAAFGSG